MIIPPLNSSKKFIELFLFNRQESSKLNESHDDISGAAMVLARYIETTGDLDGVVDFLRSMVSSGKLPEEDGMSYIAEVLSSLQTLKASYNHQEMDPAQALRHFIQARRGQEPVQGGQSCSGGE